MRIMAAMGPVAPTNAHGQIIAMNNGQVDGRSMVNDDQWRLMTVHSG